MGLFICFLIFTALFRNSLGIKYVVTAPNTIRVGVRETVGISISEHANPVNIQIYLQDHPGNKKIISLQQFIVQDGKPHITELILQPKDLPELQKNDPKLNIKLVVKATNNEFPAKEVILPVTKFSGYAFIQTDKPIYLPSQQVLIRILHLNESLFPSNEPFWLKIENPLGTLVLNKEFMPHPKGITETNFRFSTIPVYGNWSVSVHYGYLSSAKSTVRFEVRDYVLPTFSVEIKPPRVILDTDKEITGTIEAKYVYGKPVEGFVSFEYKVRNRDGIAVSIGTAKNLKLHSGSRGFHVRVRTDLMKKVQWFPHIDKSVFIIEARVVETATGKFETAMDDTTVFTTSPYIINLSRSMTDFKPGVPYQIMIDVRYINNQLIKKKLEIKIAKAEAKKSNGQTRQLQQQQTLFIDKIGRVLIQFDTEHDDQELMFTVKTADEHLVDGNQASAVLTVQRYNSPVANTYIWIAAPQEGTHFQVGKTFHTSATIYPGGQAKISYLVASKGRILLMNETESKGSAVIRTVQFVVTADMVPTFRLVVFIIKNNKIVSDSLQIEVEKTCKYNNGKELSIKAHTKSGIYTPGQDVNFKIHGEEGSQIGLLAVDEAIYLLNKQDLLSREKMFSEMDNHDLGHGPGGGGDPGKVFRNAGILVLSNAEVNPHGRENAIIQAGKRRKRNAEMQDTIDKYSGNDRRCCLMGLLKGHKNQDCYDRAAILANYTQGNISCSEAFLDCCQAATNLLLSTTGDRAPGEHLQVDGLDDPTTMIELEKNTLQNIRNFFPETWFFRSYEIGDKECGAEQDRSICSIKLSAPHSITTWMVQGVAVSQTTGMCVASPLRLEVFRAFFVQLHLPATAVRGEQIEIMATVFNYEDETAHVTVFTYGVEGLCMGAGSGERSEYRKITVKGSGATSVNFPIMPLQVSEFPIKVIALSRLGSDAIEKILKVVPEGVPVVKTLSFPLDPSGLYSKKKKQDNHVHGSVTEIFDKVNNKQNIQVELDFPKDYVPGTEKCIVTAIGSLMGQAINTTLSGLEGKFMKIPTGCGEQTMIFLAPLVYTMTYFKKSNLLTAEIETKGYDYMYKGYAHQLTYRKQDGSFSVWTTYASSTWLTAFSAKVFCQASSFIKIVEDNMCKAISWMINRQRDTGVFYDGYQVHHKEMTGGVQGDVSTTAYVLISMLECKKCDSPEKRMAVGRAINYLETHVPFVKRPYAIALMAYALGLANSKKAVEANDRLRAIANYNDVTNTRFWNWDASDFGSGAKPWVYTTNPSAVAVETTSYALLTQLLHDDLEYSHAIANWLNQQRSGSGSFVSTQDTVMALQALAEYNVHAKIPPLNIACTIVSSASARNRKYIVLSQQNATVLQEVQVPAKGRLNIEVTGKGLGSMSVSLHYNVEQGPEKSCKFELTIESEEYFEDAMTSTVHPEFEDMRRFIQKDKAISDMFSKDVQRNDFGICPATMGNDGKGGGERGSCSIIEGEGLQVGRGTQPRENDRQVVDLNICVRYLENTDAGMSILDIGLLTGYKVERDDLKNLTLTKSSGVSNIEETDRSIVLYLDEVPHKSALCIRLKTVKDIHVGKVQPTAVKIYDYYEPDKACTKFYGPDGKSAMIKPVCEGKQCFCLEGLCPSCTPFAHVLKLKTDELRRTELMDMACDRHNFVWNGTIVNHYKNGSFRYYEYNVVKVVKAGIQSPDELEGTVITFVSRDACPCPKMEIGKIYIIMSNDGFQYKTEDGELKFKYLINKDTSVYNSRRLSELTKPRYLLQKAFNSMYPRLIAHGCTH